MKSLVALLLGLFTAGWAAIAAADCPPPRPMLEAIREAKSARLVRLGSRVERSPDPLQRGASSVGFRRLESSEISPSSLKRLVAAYGRTSSYACTKDFPPRKVEEFEIPFQLGLEFIAERESLRLVVLEPEKIVQIHMTSGPYAEALLSAEGLQAWVEALAAILGDRGEASDEFFARMGAHADSAEVWARMAKAAGADTLEIGEGPPLEPALKAGPVYPSLAREAGVDGTVWLDLLVGADGMVHRVRVVRSIPMLDAAAIESVRQWKYEPVIRNGRRVAVWTRVPVKFSLHGP